MRLWAVLGILAILALAAGAKGILAGVRGPTPPALAIAELESFDGAVIVFAPNTCNLQASLFRALNEVDHLDGVSVRGVVLGVGEDTTELKGVANDFEAKFPLSGRNGETWTKGLEAAGLSEPILFVIRHRQVTMTLAGDALRGWRGIIPGFPNR